MKRCRLLLLLVTSLSILERMLVYNFNYSGFSSEVLFILKRKQPHNGILFLILFDCFGSF